MDGEMSLLCGGLPQQISFNFAEMGGGEKGMWEEESGEERRGECAR